ncbi:hypothetical protein TBLA_0C03990 [Henningerozyma blattae CBS 6284]|uniref:Uncharacterized protein n=1 Tax=Henningerozyma blattae (strain ATCC 34711 / CBS 6284 / DSM 70876 / NBRC 10599 / NRRL Y-10934 / UCD 77-7) TaxID=1071380 RepID=I2H1E7_HENB6|nr:hypothetical protein TBLA_0C03990 [Tetrapisispora blattae CBS 6284]CCH60199.1 hypothetical protein TBLA_0C03990 [Tetrapisispora blattae CBS 6284]
MNLLLQDPFLVLKEYPEKLTNTLETPLNTECVQFSPRGDYLAVGCVNGAVVIYDMDTFRPVFVLGSRLDAHRRSVQSIAWSPSGRYILTASRDWFIKLWDLQSPQQPLRQLRFTGPVWNVHWINAANFACVATVLEEKMAYLIDFSLNEPNFAQLDTGLDSIMEQDQRFVITSVVHPKYDNILVTGTSKGWINFYLLADSNSNENVNETKLIHSVKIGNCNIKQIIISENGDKLAINGSDKTIRQYGFQISFDNDNMVELDLEHKYQDVINKLQWNNIIFSNKSADYIVASTHGSLAHELYIWETNTGTLVRVLEGAEEELMDISWNFYNMCLASNGLETGYIYIWSIVVPPKWSALAPDFEEIEENIEYLEGEDEFDEIDEQGQQQDLDQAKEIKIDLLTQEKFDVRGNDLSMPKFIIPIQYQQILLMNSQHFEEK